MIQQFFNGMLTLLLVKFILNDVPHAISSGPPWGALDTKIKPVVQLLTDGGYTTLFSCQGGIGHDPLGPYVGVDGKHGEDVTVLLEKAGYRVRGVVHQTCAVGFPPKLKERTVFLLYDSLDAGLAGSANAVEFWNTGSLNSLENSLRMDPRGQKPGAIHRAKERILAGHRDPVILDYEHGKYTIRDGRHRLEAYTQLGYERVPVVVYGQGG